MNSFTNQPRSLFLIDGLGAMLSAILLGVVLVQFENFFGIPIQTLYILASLPIFFAGYDFYCFQLKDRIKSGHLKGIAIINLFYCCLSVGMAYRHMDVVTVWGWIYILGEVAIVTGLAYLEFMTAKALESKSL